MSVHVDVHILNSPPTKLSSIGTYDSGEGSQKLQRIRSSVMYMSYTPLQPSF